MSTHSNRPTAFVQVDVDGLWAVRRCYGQGLGSAFRDDPCWTEGVPRLRRLFDQLGIPATFFLVGCDMRVPEKRAIARTLHRFGHEIGNHSWQHRIGLTQIPVGGMVADLQRAHHAIVAAELPPPVGFRSPGYDIDVRLMRVVRRMGYAYDASLLPTPLVPMLRAADAVLARRTDPDKRQFGRFAYWRAPRVPYQPDRFRVRRALRSAAPDDLWELPVSTVGPWRFPLTGSAIFAFGPEKVIRWLESTPHSVQLVLHAIDLVDTRQHRVFARWFQPRAGGFNLTAQQKRERLEPVLRFLSRRFHIRRACDFVAAQYPQ